MSRTDVATFRDDLVTWLDAAELAPPFVGAGTLDQQIEQYFRDGFYPTGSQNDADGFMPSGPLRKAVLINGQSSSGGDAFPYYFQELGLGPLIGERTWGGLVGISGNPGFVDGGGLSVPAFAFVNAEGEWAVEGEGVAPDIEVLDRPEEIAAGREPIIERAVEYLLQELEKEQYQRPGTPEGAKRGHPGGN